jgi:hypothetical protein
MSLYNLFSVSDISHPYDIETSGKSIMRNLTHGKVKSWLLANHVQSSDADVEVLLNNMKKYVCASASILLDPGLKDCYDAWVCSLENKSYQSISKARMMYMNAHNCDVKFGKGCFDMLVKDNDSFLVKKRVYESEKKETHPTCRWCKKEFHFNSFSILQCKCTARIGHENCASGFASEYKEKCPICRGKLLKRKEISKYMFWGIENKFKL